MKVSRTRRTAGALAEPINACAGFHMLNQLTRWAGLGCSDGLELGTQGHSDALELSRGQTLPQGWALHVQAVGVTRRIHAPPAKLVGAKRHSMLISRRVHKPMRCCPRCSMSHGPGCPVKQPRPLSAPCFDWFKQA